MDAEEEVRIELGFDRVHRLAKQVRLGADVQLDVVAGRVNPLDLGRAHEEHASAGFHHEPLERVSGRLQSMHQLQEPPFQFAIGPALQLRPRARQGILEAIAIERLEQVVQRVHLERAERVSVERGDEDDERHPLRADGLDQLESGCTRHLHIEEHEIRTKGLDCRHRRRAILALGDDLHPVFEGEQHEQPLPREGLVVGNDHADPGR
jgi:hypothetical protein